MTALLDGFSVLEGNWRLVFGMLFLILLGQLLVYSVLKSIFGHGLTAEEYFSLGLAGWILPVSLISLLWYLSGIVHMSRSSILILIIPLTILAIILVFRIKKQTTPNSKAAILGLLLLFWISIPLRLALVSKVLMPLYFDSARHYMIIKSLLGNIGPPDTIASFQGLGTNYYHMGFHFLAAFLASILQVEITKTMLIVGQMILAVTPLAVFFIIRHETGSNSAGIFAVLLAGFGWSMPAYAVNWGKYPALTGLALIPFVLCLAYLAVQSRDTLSTRKSWALSAMLISGVLLSGLFHSRALVIIGIAILAGITARGWQNLPRLPRSLIFYMTILGIVLEIILIHTREVLVPLFNPYGPKGFLVTSMILILLVFAQKTYPRLAFSNILAIFLLLGSLFIPTLNFIPRFANLTLLDRTFVELILYLPLSLLGGLGLAGLEQTLRPHQARPGGLRILRGGTIGVLFSGLVLGNALLHYELYPTDCCNIVGQDDLAAIDWMDENLPLDARILISGTELIVQSKDAVQGYAPADAGAWITPLTGRVTIPLPYDTDLGKRKKFNSLCRMGINYIYVGAAGRSFYAPRLRAHPDRYTSLLSMPRAEVYQVIGCK
jgi:hypothetical protein